MYKFLIYYATVNWPPKGGISAIPAVRLWWLDTGTILHTENVWIWNTNFNILPGSNPGELGLPKTPYYKILYTCRFKSLNVPKSTII